MPVKRRVWQGESKMKTKYKEVNYDFEIKKGAMPPKSRNVNAKWCFHKLLPGHYFDVPGNHPGVIRNKHGSCSLHSAVASYNKRHAEKNGFKIITRRLVDDSIRVGVE